MDETKTRVTGTVTITVRNKKTGEIKSISQQEVSNGDYTTHDN